MDTPERQRSRGSKKQNQIIRTSFDTPLSEEEVKQKVHRCGGSLGDVLSLFDYEPQHSATPSPRGSHSGFDSPSMTPPLSRKDRSSKPRSAGLAGSSEQRRDPSENGNSSSRLIPPEKGSRQTATVNNPTKKTQEAEKRVSTLSANTNQETDPRDIPAPSLSKKKSSTISNVPLDESSQEIQSSSSSKKKSQTQEPEIDDLAGVSRGKSHESEIRDASNTQKKKSHESKRTHELEQATHPNENYDNELMVPERSKSRPRRSSSTKKKKNSSESRTASPTGGRSRSQSQPRTPKTFEPTPPPHPQYQVVIHPPEDPGIPKPVAVQEQKTVKKNNRECCIPTLESTLCPTM